MPIKGLTDRGAAFPRIGELRKGAPKPERGPGRDLTYFRFASASDDAARAFQSAYGDEPAAVNVFLPYPTTDANFEAWWEEWGAGSLKWRGDGETLALWQTPRGTYSQEPKPQPAQGGQRVGRLKVIIPALGRLAYVVALTTSIHDISELHANLTAYEALRGDLRGIPFVLSRVPRMISTPGKDGQRVRREKWLLHIEAAPEWVQAQLSVMERAALPTIDAPPALGDGVPDDDDAEVGQWETVEPAPSPNGSGAQPEPEPVDALAQNGHDTGRIADVRTTLKEWTGKFTLGTVAQKAADTGVYSHANHALNAMRGSEDKPGFAFPDGVTVEMKQVISAGGALQVFDWLMERKAEAA